MRSPVIAFGLFAVTVSPSLIAAAPTGPSTPGVPAITGATQGVSGATADSIPPALPLGPVSNVPHRKRADDANTAGGNARTGNTNSASGGSVVNNADPDTELTSDDSSTFIVYVRSIITYTVIDFGGDANDSITGDATGGDGQGRGPGGNAYTGNSGLARGGSVFNSAGSVSSTDGSSKHRLFI